MCAAAGTALEMMPLLGKLQCNTSWAAHAVSCSTLSEVHSSLHAASWVLHIVPWEVAVRPQATRVKEVCACPGKHSILSGPEAHLQEVTELLSPSVLQMVVTLQPVKHVLQPQRTRRDMICLRMEVKYPDQNSLQAHSLVALTVQMCALYCGTKDQS